MSTNEYINEFVDSLPRGPLVPHIGQIHAILVWSGGGRTPNGLAAAEHSLREIARYTMNSPYEEAYRRQREREQERERQQAEDQRALSAQFPLPLDFATTMRKAFKNVEEALARMRIRQEAKRTPQQREDFSIRQYDRRVLEERQAGVAFVKAEGARVRKELGLDG